MAMNIDALLRIKADVQGENNIKRLGNSMQGVTGKVNNLKMAVGGLSASFKALGAALAVDSFAAFIKSGIDAADAMGKASTRTGVAAQALLGMQNAAALADVSNEQLVKGLTKLNVNMVAAAEGNEELTKRFQQLGIQIKKEDGTLKSTEEAFAEIADRFADMPNGAQKAAAAMSLFGKSGVELITLLNGGSKSLEEFNYKLSDDFAQRSEVFNDSITKMGFKTQGFQMQLMDALLPALQSIIDVFSELFNSEQDFTALFDVIKAGLRTVATFVYANVALFGAMARGVVGAFQVVSQAVRGDFQGAWNTFTSTVSTQVDQAKKDFESLQRLWTDSAAPTGVTGRRSFDLRDLREERERDAAASRAATAEQRAAEKAANDYNNALLKSADLAAELKRRIRDINLATNGLGETARQAIDREYQEALNNIADEGERIKKTILELRELSGNTLMFEGLVNADGTGLAQQFLNALGQQAEIDRILKLGQLQAQEAQAASAQAMEGMSFGVGGGPLSGMSDVISQAKAGLQELAAPLNAIRGAAETMGQSFGNAFRGLVSGSMSAKQALASFFEAVGKSFMDLATQIITQLITITILESISSIFGASGGLSGKGALGNSFPAATSISGTNVSAAGLGSIGTPGSSAGFGGFSAGFAAGGFVTGPTRAMVGEGGQPEYVIPASKMRTAMSRYSRGARGAAVIPGSGTEPGGGSAATATMQPIDVRYSVERINNVDYVTADQFQQGMAQAAQQGAVQGERRAMRSLKNSSATRRSVGI
jgi:signal transduction histidine kinase